jgi:hypothetical protein
MEAQCYLTMIDVTEVGMNFHISGSLGALSIVPHIISRGQLIRSSEAGVWKRFRVVALSN